MDGQTQAGSPERVPAERVPAERIAIKQMFPTPLASTDHPEAASLNARLRAAILAQEAASPGVHHSNDGGWQSSDDFLGWSGEAGAELLAFTKGFANSLSAVWVPERGLVEVDLDWTFNAWANVNRAGHANEAHIHPGAYWSAVYYVDDGLAEGETGRGGELEFTDPRGAMPAMLAPHLRMKIEGCIEAGHSHAITPRAGTLVMFPSWLLHAVKRFTGVGPRISIAINLAPAG